VETHGHTLDQACPWYDLKSLRLPKVKWCEEELCSWVESPAMAWSNLGYIAVGLIMIALSKNLKSRPLRFFGYGAIIVGLSSLAYHVSNSFALQIFDFFGMYVDCYLLLFINLQRLGKNVLKGSFKKYWAAVTLTTALTVAFDFTTFPIQGLVFVLILGIVATEFMNWKAKKSPYSLGFFFASLVSMTIAISCSILDVKRVFCNPMDHLIQGHALWHWFGSIAMLFSFLHYRQFDRQLEE
jgi:hypothetical protein